MTQATLGERYQVVIPREERRKVELKAGQKVEVVARGDHIEVYPVAIERLRGIGRELADGRDATDYVRELRAEWGTRP
ncbi:MAG: AbrB/MazE/SpoVT family DNA-binding domain-containing protein [Kiritimatiellae bacterium]|nr:AbrB/MazE/SpoVT family DNA-binding domain-containing protein [Kiritimatiellia bacterium]